MTTEHLNSDSSTSGGENSMNIRENLSKYLFHWPVFIVGIIMCLILAFLYLRYTPKVFLVNTTLLIKDSKKSGGGAAGGDLLNELDIFGNSKVVDNEIEILKSKTLMRSVVDRLNLAVTFKSEGNVLNSDLYLSKPVNFGIVKMDSLWYGKTLKLSFPTSDSYILEEPESGKKVKGGLNVLQRSIFGIYKIDKNDKFKNIKKSTTYTLLVSDPQSVVNSTLSNLSIGLSSKQSTVLKLSYEAGIPEKGQDVLNTLIAIYNEASLADKNKTISSTIQFIDERLKLITGELTDVEKDVEFYKSSRGIVDISNDANAFLESVKVNDAKLNEIDLQLSVIKEIRNYVNASSPQEKLPTTLGISDPVLLNQINQLSELQLQRDRMLETTTADNPLVAPILKQLETTRAGIKSSVQNIYNSLMTSRNALQGNNLAFQGSIKKIPGQERQLIGIKRQQSIKESLYLYLLQKKEESALSYASSIADSRIVDSAFYSRSPIKPNRQLVYVAAILFGFILPIGYIYAKDLLNNKINGLSDVSKITSIPVLGEVQQNESGASVVVQSESRTAISEQFRSIRTNMQFLHGKGLKDRGRVTLFTSSMSGEGKSFVCSNLAVTLALSGKRTVLLELDLRKPKVSTYLSLANNLGLSNYLIGRAEMAEIIKPSSINPNFYVIGSGPIPPNPSELLIQDEIEVLIEYLRLHFDEIIIDTPPIGLVADAQILGRLADASVYLIRQNVTLKEQVQALDQLYLNKKLPKLNIILNGVNTGGKYGYGYYSDDHTQKKITYKSLVNSILKRF